jgi:hypothetical protein
LRTEEKKREALRIKEAKITPPITPSEPIPALTTPVIETPVELVLEAQADIRAEVTPLPNQVDESLVNPEEIAQAEQDIPQPSIEVRHRIVKLQTSKG